MRFYFILSIFFITSISFAQAQKQEREVPQALSSVQITWEVAGENSLQAILYHALRAYKERLKGTSFSSAIQELPGGHISIQDESNNQIICERRLFTDDSVGYRIVFRMDDLKTKWSGSILSAPALVYAALEAFYEIYRRSDAWPAKLLLKKRDGSLVLKDGEKSLICRITVQGEIAEGQWRLEFSRGLEATLEKLDRLLESRGMKTKWFTQDLARGFDQDILRRTGNVRAEVLLGYVRYRLALEGLEKDLEVDQDSLAFQTLLAEMQKGRFSVLEKLPALTGTFVKEGLKQIKKR